MESNTANLSNNLFDIEVADCKEKCQNWLEVAEQSKNGNSTYSESEISEESVFSELTKSSVTDYSRFLFSDVKLENTICTRQHAHSQNSLSYLDLPLKKEPQKYDNININKSKNIHIGDVTIIKGSVILNTDQRRLSKTIDENNNDSFGIILRRNWLAQPPIGKKDFLNGPAKFVIIGHTATEEGFTQAENTLLIRLIQTFHIESRQWQDIAYNFLVGSDGLIYEGRGWGVEGAHTRKYNRFSVGISFIGCFLDHLPPTIALKKAKELIAEGIKRGYIAEDYKLLAHCQCSGVESPGKSVFEEIKTWPNWDGSVTVREPADGVYFNEELLDSCSNNIP